MSKSPLLVGRLFKGILVSVCVCVNVLLCANNLIPGAPSHFLGSAQRSQRNVQLVRTRT